MSEVLSTTLKSNHDVLRSNPKSDGMILIIDPMPSSACITAANLQSWGYSVDIVHSFPIALELLKDGELIPDLILVDILNTLHLKQALRFPAHLRNETVWGNIPIVARSAMKERITIEKVLRAGYNDYIIAPVEKELLRDRIDKVFHSTLSINPMTFPKSISTSASLVSAIYLTSINEFGIEGFSNTPFTPQTIFTLQSEILESFGLDQVLVKVVGCDALSEGNWRYKMALSFVGISPLVQNRIRQFAIASKTPIKSTGDKNERH